MLVLKNVAIVVVVLAAFGFLCGATCLANNIQFLQNGSFENTTGVGTSFENGSTDGLGGPTTQVNYWTCGHTIKDGMGWINYSTPPTTEDGNRMIDVIGANGGYIEQGDNSNNLIPLVYANQTYTVSYWERNRAAVTLQTTITIDTGYLTGTNGIGGGTFSGSGGATLTQITPSNNSSWTNFTFTFVPSQNGHVTLKFFNPNSGDGGDGVYLDNSSLIGPSSPVPEPGTFALLAAGLAGLLCYAWRKRR